MQVKIETSKGEVLCVLMPPGLKSYRLCDDMGDNLLDIRSENKFKNIRLDKCFKLIAPLSEVTEQQSKMMVDEVIGISSNRYVDYSANINIKCWHKALDSFKSLIQANEVYEVNPLNGIQSMEWEYFESRTGRWIILFKEK